MFRPDIEGLRAVAVLSVMLYHYTLGPFHGGFVGVDIFFVISGYVIAQSLAARNTGHFLSDFLAFCERRIRRLLPALIPVIVVVYIGGYLLYLDTGFEALSRNVRALGLAATNWSLLGQTGYFDAPAAANPVLHTWSLSVEAQYYFVAPLLFYAAARRFKAAPAAVSLWLAIASFIVATILILGGRNDDAFFNSIARFWEIAIGAILATSPHLQITRPGWSTAARVAGLALIGVAVFGFSDTTPFPGPAALLPVAGAVLIVASNPRNTDPFWSLLSAKSARYLGRLSYSLYLWHWPILVLTLTLFPGWSLLPLGTSLALSIFLAVGSYHLIESPVGRWKLTQRHVFIAAGLISATLLGVGHVGVALKGIPQRLPADVRLALSGKTDIGRGLANCLPENWRLFGTTEGQARTSPCLLGDANRPPSFLLFGDSHSGALIAEFDALARVSGRTGLGIGYPSCAPIVTLRNKSTNHPGCEWLNQTVVGYLRSHPEIATVVLAARWETYTESGFYEAAASDGRMSFVEGLEQTLAEVSGDHREIWVLGQVPSHPVLVPESLAVDTMVGRPLAAWATTATDHNRSTKFVTRTFRDLEAIGMVRFLDLAVPLCSTDQCLVHVDGRPLYSDTNHLSNFGGTILAPLLDSAIRPINPL